MSYKISQVQLSNKIQFLIEYKKCIESGLTNKSQLQKKYGISGTELTALKTLGYINEKGDKFLLGKIEPIHARKLIEKRREIYNNSINKRKNTVMQKDNKDVSPVDVIPVVSEQIKIEESMKVPQPKVKEIIKKSSPIYKPNVITTVHSVNILWGAYKYTKTIIQ